MKLFFKPILILFALILFSAQNAFAIEDYQYQAKPRVAVITDVNHRAGTIYLVTGASSEIIASDIITALNASNRVTAPVLGDSMQRITNNFNFYTTTFFNEYKYNYNVDFVNLRRITKELDADYLLMVTSGLDVQSNFLKDTIWNKLSISGMDPVKPSYRLTTLLTLIDLNAEAVLWQELYKKDITANNYDIGVVQFAPSYAQLSKIKKYSKRVSEHVTPIVNVKINPALAAKREVSAVQIRKKDLTEDKSIYYPTIRTEQFKRKAPQEEGSPSLFREQEEPQREPFIEDVNNFTPKNTDTTTNYTEPVMEEEVEESTLQKPELKPAVNIKKKESLPKYEWNIKNIYDQPASEKKESLWKKSKPKSQNIETVFL